MMLLGVACGSHAGVPPPLRTPIAFSVEAVSDVVIDRHEVLYASSEYGVRRFDLRTRVELPQLQLPGAIPTTLDLDPAGCRMAIGDRARHGLWVLESLSGSEPRFIPFPASNGYEGFGSFSVIWETPTTLLSTSLYSGWGALRRTAIDSSEVVTIASPTDASMLAMSADRSRWAMVEAGISSGPVHVFATGSSIGLDRAETSWSNFEVAISRAGDVVVVPTAGGAHVYDVVNDELVGRPTRLGAYSQKYPIGMAFSPHTSTSFSAWYDRTLAERGLLMYTDHSFETPIRIDSPPFEHTGNQALAQGRTRISADGRHLTTTLRDQVLVYDVAQWASDPELVFKDGLECDAWR